MKERHIVARVLVVILGLLVAVAGWQVWSSAADAAKMSAVLALFDEIERKATPHYEEFGTYPSTLDELAITRFPDGGDAALLDEIAYETDGETATLEWGEFHRTMRPGEFGRTVRRTEPSLAPEQDLRPSSDELPAFPAR